MYKKFYVLENSLVNVFYFREIIQIKHLLNCDLIFSYIRNPKHFEIENGCIILLSCTKKKMAATLNKVLSLLNIYGELLMMQVLKIYAFNF